MKKPSFKSLLKALMCLVLCSVLLVGCSTDNKNENTAIAERGYAAIQIGYVKACVPDNKMDVSNQENETYITFDESDIFMSAMQKDLDCKSCYEAIKNDSLSKDELDDKALDLVKQFVDKDNVKLGFYGMEDDKLEIRYKVVSCDTTCRVAFWGVLVVDEGSACMYETNDEQVFDSFVVVDEDVTNPLEVNVLDKN